MQSCKAPEKEYIVLPVVPICIPFYALGAAAARETGGSFSNHGLFSHVELVIYYKSLPSTTYR